MLNYVALVPYPMRPAIEVLELLEPMFSVDMANERAKIFSVVCSVFLRYFLSNWKNNGIITADFKKHSKLLGELWNIRSFFCIIALTVAF